MAPVFSYPEKEVLDIAGLDTVVFIRLLKLGEDVLVTFRRVWLTRMAYGTAP